MAEKKAFPLRLDPALHDAVQRLADAELRSVNAEIEVLLREALARRGVKVARAEPVRRGRPPAADRPGDPA
ncbi:MAG: toxin-antitoxin system HicB family antitoxin [Erythrobacter sp.]|nr:toxin-antitoxin system HicB family antitoxin [Erythrobacter sp.]MBA4080085.1 toxin-antitoxin system HicB family antitoxin [Erythrobacter sp.]